MRTTSLQTEKPQTRPSLVDLYSNSPNTELLLKLMKKPKLLNRVATKVPKMNQLELSGGQVIIQNPNIRLQALSEIMIAQAFLRLRVSVMFEPVYFNLTKTGLTYRPDIWTNIYLKERDLSKIFIMEAHAFSKIREIQSSRIERLRVIGRISNEQAEAMYEYERKKERATVNKISAMHLANPNLSLRLRSDMSVEQFKSEFGISDINAVCDEYKTEKGFGGLDTLSKFESRMMELKMEMRQIIRMPTARIQKDLVKWRADVSEIIKQELLKALR